MDVKQKIAIIGDGAMGTVCAIILSELGMPVRLWSAFPQAADKLAKTRVNERFLPGFPLPGTLEITGNDSEALRDAELAVSAVPTQFMRSVWNRLAPHTPANMPICSVAKGIEQGTLLRPSEIILDVLDGGKTGRPVAALSGPSIAPEVAAKLPATVTVAATDPAFARRIQQLFSCSYFRVYTNSDLIGVEIAGATKNVIAIAAGILDGLRTGDNAKAALLTRGLVEITRLGAALGAKPETFAGLAGMGDLVTTCISQIGRNRSFGEAIGQGKSVKEALAATASVVEGAATVISVTALADKLGVEMPITRGVYDVIVNGQDPAKSIIELMRRPLRSETV